MARKRRAVKRELIPDPKYNDLVVTRFVSTLLKRGKKSTAEKILYQAIDKAAEKASDDGLKIFKKAIENCKPVLEVKSRRVGGATYQVPIEVKPERRQSLSIRWIVEASRSRGENSMMERLAGEFVEAAEGRGNAMKKREDVHRMAEANKAFSHFRW